MNVVLSKGKILVAIFAIVVAVVIVLYASQKVYLAKGELNKNLTVGDYAPDSTFFFANGTEANLSSYKGHEVLLWFVATWCSGCAQGNELLNSSYKEFSEHGVKVLELELYNDLGYSGENIVNFVQNFAPEAYQKRVVIPAYASYNMTLIYDRQGYLDIYYLISPDGKILYENASLGATLPELLSEINKTGVI